ncbi:MAG: hypothetical protein K2L74_02555 [Muribaculaceae bacterium]|nr:hypothetical protein [Muribaculaceae bacterium]
MIFIAYTLVIDGSAAAPHQCLLTRNRKNAAPAKYLSANCLHTIFHVFSYFLLPNVNIIEKMHNFALQKPNIHLSHPRL